MSLLLLFAGLGGDRHDRAIADLYRKRKRRGGQTLLDEDTAKASLRAALEEVVETIPEAAALIPELVAEPSLPDLGPLAYRLGSLLEKMKVTERRLIEAAIEEWKRQDEEEIEMLLLQ